MTRTLSLLALVSLLSLVCSPDAVMAGPKAGMARREEALVKRHWPGWNSTVTVPTATSPGGDGGGATPTDSPGSPGGGGGGDGGAPGGGGGGSDTTAPTGTDSGGEGATDTAPGPISPTEAPTGDSSVVPPPTDTSASPPPTDTSATAAPTDGSGGTTDTLTPTFTQSIDPNAPSFSQSLAPAPTGGSLSTNVTVPTNASGIFYTGGTWGDSDSCDENTKVTRDVGGQMDCSFLGTAIFMSTVVGPNAGVYTATIDNETVIVDAYRNTSEPACDVSWSRFGLENTTHVVTVVFKGASTEAGPAGASNASLEITRFTVTTEGPPTSGGASGAAVGMFEGFGTTMWTAASALGVVGALWL